MQDDVSRKSHRLDDRLQIALLAPPSGRDLFLSTLAVPRNTTQAPSGRIRIPIVPSWVAEQSGASLGYTPQKQQVDEYEANSYKRL
jgi:hypothetical protein